MKLHLSILLSFLFLIGCSSQQKTEENKQKKDKDGSGQVWWKEGIVYQIYPRSFNDSDGDGMGDLKGIIQKLDYIKSLGVSMVWMNPFLKSPNVDNGYDVSDYRDIDPLFGTMADFDELLKGLHERDIKFVLDVVVNHSSNQHEWFKQSRSSRDNPYRDYYHWWPAEKGEPNYRYSLFDETGNAWKYDSLTDAYYLHYFAKEQPDLKWENPKVRQEVYDIMKFWAEKGVDGFRLDAFQFVAKDTTYPKFPEGFEKDFIPYYGMVDGLHGYLKEMNEEVLSKYDVFAVSEGSGSTLQDAHDLVDKSREELQMVYHFEAMDVGSDGNGYELSELKNVFTKWDDSFEKDGWLSVFLANHDVPRMVSKYGNDSPEFRVPSAKMLNTFMLSMKGTPYCYFGDELGMTNIDFPTIDRYQDVAAINGYKKAQSNGEDMEQFMLKLNKTSRDNSRTPMQWNGEEHAGFTTGTPWLPVNENYTEINAAAQEKDPNSILNHFRAMAKLRNENKVLVYGDYELLQKEHPTIYAYTRTWNGEKMLVLLNFAENKSTIELKGELATATVKINNYEGLTIKGNAVELQPYQGVVLKL